ncbi:hypothetical protein BT69DRAFT_1156666 [Atractiella rhizophila]|nr:hypothetical protein BT69DRAFT_1156666 [Atractiella rhizophila]
MISLDNSWSKKHVEGKRSKGVKEKTRPSRITLDHPSERSAKPLPKRTYSILSQSSSSSYSNPYLSPCWTYSPSSSYSNSSYTFSTSPSPCFTQSVQPYRRGRGVILATPSTHGNFHKHA